MLCKTTMRAALAHVLGTVGIVGAFGAVAAPDHPYAAESLSGMAPYSINGSPMGEIVLDVKLDTLLPGGSDTFYYLVVNFWSAQLTSQLGLTYTVKVDDNTAADGTTVVPDGGDVANDPVGTVQPILGTGTGFRFFTYTASVPANAAATPPVAEVVGAINDATNVTLTRAFQGDATHTSGAYRMAVTGDGLAIDTRIRLELGTNLAIPNKNAASYRGDLYIYDELGDARAAARASAPGDVPDNHVFAAYNKLFEVANKIAAPTITPLLATADVGYERTGDPENNVSTGGPFRGFTGVGNAANVGVLATITLNEKMDNPRTTMVNEGAFLDASDGSEMYDGAVNSAARVVVTSDVMHAFGFGNGAGTGANGERRITGDNPATPTVETDFVLNAGGAPSAFRIGTASTDDDGDTVPNMTSCSGGSALTLSAPNADGDQVSINPLADTDPTYSRSANQGSTTVTGSGPFQLCVNVGENEVAIPDVGGDDRMLGGYKMTVTPMSGPRTARANGPAASGPAGSIERNGTTVNISYLSVHPAYNQRLVIVNRGSRDAEFWMDDFQTEEGTEISGDIRGTVAAGSRMVIRVQDELTVDMGQLRASGTINLTARSGAVDIMTIQENIGTGQLDTTMYDPM